MTTYTCVERKGGCLQFLSCDTVVTGIKGSQSADYVRRDCWQWWRTGSEEHRPRAAWSSASVMLGACFARAPVINCMEPIGVSSLASHKPHVSEMLLFKMLRSHGLLNG